MVFFFSEAEGFFQVVSVIFVRCGGHGFSPILEKYTESVYTLSDQLWWFVFAGWNVNLNLAR